MASAVKFISQSSIIFIAIFIRLLLSLLGSFDLHYDSFTLIGLLSKRDSLIELPSELSKILVSIEMLLSTLDIEV